MTINEFMWFCTDEEQQEIKVWDIEEQKIIFCGFYGDAPVDLCYTEIQSFDMIVDEYIVFNI